MIDIVLNIRQGVYQGNVSVMVKCISIVVTLLCDLDISPSKKFQR